MSRRILAIAGDCAVGRTCQRMLCPEEYHIEFCENPTAAVQAALTGDARPCCSAKPPLDSTRSSSSASFARPPSGRLIVLGNNPTVGAAVAAIKEGAADYLHEPCSAEALLAALRRSKRRPGGRGFRAGRGTDHGLARL